MKILDYFEQWTIVKKSRLTKLQKLFSDAIYNSVELEEVSENRKQLIQELEKKLFTLSQKADKFKLPKPSKITYKAPDRKELTYYVRDTNSKAVKKIANLLLSNSISSSDSEDSVVLKCMKWLDNKFKKREFVYKSEPKEYWNTPDETLNNNKNKSNTKLDCDDYGILLYSVIRAVFKKLKKWDKVSNRLFCAVGGVNKRGYFPDPAEVHFYLVWKHSDGEFYSVETTYYRGDAIGKLGKVPHKDNKIYNYMRYIFNEKNAYRVHSFR